MGAPVSQAFDRSGWKPSPDQELLLRAALWQGDAARTAWKEWSARSNLAGLNRAERRILPLVYLNLRDSGLTPTEIEYLAEPYQSFRALNQLVMQRAAAAIQTLEQAGIPTLVLKGMALIPLYYHDPGARPARDIDILVPTARARDGIRVLYQAGWLPEDRTIDTLDDAYLHRHYSHTLRNAEQIQLDLHRHVLRVATRPDEDADFWAAAIPVHLEGIETKALCPADQLLHTCIHGSDWNLRVAPIRWVTDAYTLLSKTAVDWDRFLAQTEQRHVVMQVRSLLAYLQANLKAQVPDAALQTLKSMKVSPFDRVQYQMLALPPARHNTLVKLWYHYQKYRELSQDYKSINWLGRFPRFLRDTWMLEDTRQVPMYMFRYILRRPTPKIIHVAQDEGVVIRKISK